MGKKIILIDGNSLVYRAFFALPTTLATSAGRVTNAVYGFTSMLLKLIREEKPDVVGVAFDRGPSFRKEHFAEYKAHRPEAPDELPAQFELVKDVLRALKIPIFEMPNYEADDVLASLAKRARERDNEVIIVTGDKDALQLVTDGVKIMTTKKGISDIVIYDREAVVERYGVPPERFVDFLALKGDASDNIPGVPGIGDKTAAKLIQEFGTVENLLDNLSRLENERLRRSLEEHSAEARLSKRLAILETELPIDVDLEDFELGRWDEEDVRSVFTYLEFNTLLERFFGLKPSEDADLEVAEAVEAKELGPGELEGFARRLADCDRYAVYLAADGESIDKRAASLAFALTDGEATYVARPPADESGRRAFFAALKEELEDSKPRKIVFDFKEALHCFHNEGIELKGIAFDVLLAAYLHYPGRTAYPLEELAAFHLKRKLPEVFEGGEFGARALAVLELASILEELLKEQEMLKLLEEVEIPVARVLAKMEREGVGIDVDHFERLSKEMEITLDDIEREIFSLAGEEFNVSSSQQLGYVLFEKLGLPADRRTKTGFSTDMRVLLKLINAHPIIEKIINYREVSKLKSTYVDVLPKMINPRTGRLHTTFNQAGTSTGRLSSRDPNLQNIPVRSELGIRIREGFVPASRSDRFVAADYSQIELRLLAHFSREPLLIDTFRRGIDVHAATAQRIFGALPEQVTPQMRRIAKSINFGVLYGMSPFGLSERLNISQKEAKEYIDRYFDRYPKVRAFAAEMIGAARRRGYSLTALGRRRPIPEIASGDRRIRGLGERLAVNAPLQGSAADIIKLAMIRLDEQLEEKNLEARMVMQVHDELILETPMDEIDAVKKLVRDVMENVYPLSVPLEVEVSDGRNWKETK